MIAKRLRLLLVLPPLALAQPPAAVAAATMHLPLCGGGTIDLPLPSRHNDRDPCPTACHAVLCERGRPGGKTSRR